MAWSDCRKAVARSAWLAAEGAVELWIVVASCVEGCWRFRSDVYFDGAVACPLSRSGTRNRKSGCRGKGGGGVLEAGTCTAEAEGGGTIFTGKSGRGSISVSVPESDIGRGIFSSYFYLNFSIYLILVGRYKCVENG